jgi:hypothetical protein
LIISQYAAVVAVPKGRGRGREQLCEKDDICNGDLGKKRDLFIFTRLFLPSKDTVYNDFRETIQWRKECTYALIDRVKDKQ